MFDGPWKESSSQQPIPLHHADHRIFPYFLDWLYFQRINENELCEDAIASDNCGNCKGACVTPKTPAKPNFEPEELSREDDARLEAILDDVSEGCQLTALYIFADKFEVPELRQMIIDCHWRTFVIRGYITGYKDIINAFRNLLPSSPLCRYFVAAYASRWRAKSDEVCLTERKLRSKLPASFCFMLAAELSHKADRTTFEHIAPICDFHEHGEGEEELIECFNEMCEQTKKRSALYPDMTQLELMRIGRDRASKGESLTSSQE